MARSILMWHAFFGSTANRSPFTDISAGRRESHGPAELRGHDRHRFGKVPLLLHTDHRRGDPGACLRRKRRTRAIVIYPMNALANSQREELNKFLDQSGLPEHLRPTFARYTGQEDQEERVRIREAKPDILLTNFMMLELLMTRQNKLDQAVIENAQGLDFIVLDELHTYRGRQGADVAMLVRRLRDRLCRDRAPLCIGTSATMSSQEDETERAVAVANIASRLFETEIPPDAVIDETLQRATDAKLKLQSLGAALANASMPTLPPRLSTRPCDLIRWPSGSSWRSGCWTVSSCGADLARTHGYANGRRHARSGQQP